MSGPEFSEFYKGTAPSHISLTPAIISKYYKNFVQWYKAESTIAPPSIVAQQDAIRVATRNNGRFDPITPYAGKYKGNNKYIKIVTYVNSVYSGPSEGTDVDDDDTGPTWIKYYKDEWPIPKLKSFFEKAIGRRLEEITPRYSVFLQNDLQEAWTYMKRIVDEIQARELQTRKGKKSPALLSFEAHVTQTHGDLEEFLEEWDETWAGDHAPRNFPVYSTVQYPFRDIDYQAYHHFYAGTKNYRSIVDCVMANLGEDKVAHIDEIMWSTHLNQATQDRIRAIPGLAKIVLHDARLSSDKSTLTLGFGQPLSLQQLISSKITLQQIFRLVDNKDEVYLRKLHENGVNLLPAMIYAHKTSNKVVEEALAYLGVRRCPSP